MVRFLKVLFLLMAGDMVGQGLRKMGLMRSFFPRLQGNGQDREGWEKDLINPGRGLLPGYSISYKSSEHNSAGEPVFTKQGDEPLLISPQVRPKTYGCFKAYPGGLAINQSTGQIDINNSHTGVRYTVEFTPCGRKYSARTVVVMKGIFYPGHTLLFADDGGDLMVRPWYYSGNPREEVPTNQLPPGRFGYIPEGVNPTADLMGLKIIEDTGEIDVRETIASGALGFRREGKIPENGATREFRVYYNLANNPFKDVQNYTTVRIHFFDSVKDIPEDLQVRVNQQNRSKLQQGAVLLLLLLGLPFAWLSNYPAEVLSSLGAALSSLLLLNTSTRDHPFRPSEIIVTAN